MPPQPPLSSFTPEIKKAFEDYLDNKAEFETTLMNATKHAEYLQYLANPEQKIHKTNKVERKRSNSIKRQVIKKFSIDFRGQLLYIAQKKEISLRRKPLSIMSLIISSGYMLLEAITATRRHISGSRKRYMGYLEMMYNGFLSIAKFVLLTAKTQLERLFNLSLWRKCWTDFKRT